MSYCKLPKRSDTAERMARAWTRMEQQRRREQNRMVKELGLIKEEAS